jgi:hypothetical protein
MQRPSDSIHISKNRLVGSICDTPLERLLGECRRHLVTGSVRIDAAGRVGAIELRVGVVDSAEFDGLRDKQAVAAMSALPDGFYELSQRLPDLAGALGHSAHCEGEVDSVSLIQLMRHCENNALSCTITVIGGFDRGEVEYRAGEIVDVRFNGHSDDDRIVDMIRFKNARFRVSAPPLDLGIEGWPDVRPDPTRPFLIADERSAGLPPITVESAPGKRAPARPQNYPTDRMSRRWRRSNLAWLAAGVGLTLVVLSLLYLLGLLLMQSSPL